MLALGKFLPAALRIYYHLPFALSSFARSLALTPSPPPTAAHCLSLFTLYSVCFEKTECRFKVVFESEGTITAVSDLALALLPVL